jgi:nickel-type superoxide dismutase maturation protease
VLRRVIVDGASMAPGIVAGDRLLIARLRPRVGDVVAVRDPRQRERIIVKRVQALDAGGPLRVIGDNASESTDSRTFGPVPRDLYLGRAVYRYAPAPRAGRLSRRGPGAEPG